LTFRTFQGAADAARELKEEEKIKREKLSTYKEIEI
jgi:hypothetical protein